MRETRHRLAVYWGLRRDPGLQAHWNAAGTDARTVAVGFPLGVAVVVGVMGAGVWLARLVGGGDTSLGSIAVAGLRLGWALIVLVAAVRVLVWVRRRRSR